MTIFYPDISGFDTGIDLKGALAVCCKATEGTFYENPDYTRAKSNAGIHGTFFFAYHFLHAGNAAAQAQFCFKVVGKTPLMLDVEPTMAFDGLSMSKRSDAKLGLTSDPTIADVLTFVSEFRALGGTVHLIYLPGWYWAQRGAPPLATAFTDANLHLVSSDYAPYTDELSGVGWRPYGGEPPIVWQYTDALHFNGFTLDFNAFRGHYAGKQDPASVAACLTEFKALVNTGNEPAPAVAHNPVLDFVASPRFTQCDVSWHASPGATGYRVNVWQGVGPLRKLVQRIDTTQTRLTIFHLGERQSYNITVLAMPCSTLGSMNRAKTNITTK